MTSQPNCIMKHPRVLTPGIVLGTNGGKKACFFLLPQFSIQQTKITNSNAIVPYTFCLFQLVMPPVTLACVQKWISVWQVSVPQATGLQALRPVAVSHTSSCLSDRPATNLSSIRKSESVDSICWLQNDNVVAVLPASVFKKTKVFFFVVFFWSWCFFVVEKSFLVLFSFFKMCFFFLIMLVKVKFSKFSLQFPSFLGIVSETFHKI